VKFLAQNKSIASLQLSLRMIRSRPDICGLYGYARVNTKHVNFSPLAKCYNSALLRINLILSKINREIRQEAQKFLETRRGQND